MKKRKILFVVLLVLDISILISKTDAAMSILEQILYKSFLLSFLIPVTIASAIWCRSQKPAKKLWIIAIIVGLVISFAVYSVMPKNIMEKTSEPTAVDNHLKEEEINSKPELAQESDNSTEVTENESEISVETYSEVNGNETETQQEIESQAEELGDEPVSYTFDDEYTVGNIILHISEIQVRQSVFKAGSHILEFRIFCGLTNTSSSDQFFTATKTGNVVGVFYGEEESRIGGMENLLWDKEDYNISTGTTVPSGETKELVVQAGTIITDTITYEDELKFDIFFRNNDEILTISFDCQP